MKNYSFKEFVNSDFWNEFGGKNRNNFDYFQNFRCRVVLGVKTKSGEKFDDLIAFYYNFSEQDEASRYVKVAVCSDQQALEDLSVMIEEVGGEMYIIIPEVKCTRLFPGYPQGFFIPVRDEQRAFIEAYDGLYY